MAKDKTVQPDWPTTLRSRFPDGRCVGTDSSVWLYRSVPMAPVADAVSPDVGLEAADPFMTAFDELAKMTPIRLARRATSKSTYRQVHILLVNVPRRFVPPADHPLAGYLGECFPDAAVDRRLLLFGVRLRDKVGGAGGIKEVVASVAETLSTGTTPPSDFDADYAKVDAALARSGLVTPSGEDFRLANAWWNHGSFPDTPFLEHLDHLHVFTSADSAMAAARLGADGDDCADWPDMPNTHALAFGCVADFDLPFVTASEPAAHWASSLLDAGAVALSIRGTVEPPKVTRSELRRRRKQYIDDIRERESQGKMERSEQEEMLAELTEVEAVYSSGGAPPTLIDCSTLAVFSGRHETAGYDLSDVCRDSGLVLNSMMSRQRAALGETMLCSNIRAVPHLHDLPVQTIACSGLPSLSVVGDTEGALLGFTERDGQPAWLSPTAASRDDSLPMALCAGQTGSGKLTTLSTEIPTPAGRTTMGELAVGSEVFGRDGRPCHVVFVSEVNEQPDLYEITFDDGQKVRVDYEHQWVVSSFQERSAPRHPKRRAAIDNWEAAQLRIAALETLAGRFGPSDTLSVRDLRATLIAEGLDGGWSTSRIAQMLSFVGCPREMFDVRVPRHNSTTELVKTDPVVLFPVVDALRACQESWRSPGPGNAKRWGTNIATNITAAEKAISETGRSDTDTAAGIVRRLQVAGSTLAYNDKSRVAAMARAGGIEGRAGVATVRVPLPSETTTTVRQAFYPAATACKALAMRLRQQYAIAPSDVAAERVLTTGDMLDEGVRLSGGRTNFALRIAEPLELPDAALPIPPYLLGLWLGDGSKYHGQITVGRDELDELLPLIRAEWPNAVAAPDRRNYQVALLQPRPDLCPYGHDDWYAGRTPRRCRSCTRAFNLAASTGAGPHRGERWNESLRPKLVRAGIRLNKHIPPAYLRASRPQRLALLQGLMDTDGSIDKNGSCELSLTDECLIVEAMEMIRSLGIKASMTSGPATITEEDPDRPGQKRVRVTGTRWRISFTTNQQVFRLPRKARLVKSEVRETQRWLYVTDIAPVPTEPGRCIQVDSPDGTYLVGGFVPTHNTMLMLWLANEFARMGRPVIVLDPKLGSHHDAAVLSSGGQVVALDTLVAADGAFDPLRFSATKSAGVELASSMLLAVNPWGTDRSNFETPLFKALSYGVSQGAKCTGQALEIARDAGVAPREMVDRVFDLFDSPMFRACVGVDPQTTALRVAEGITLVKVGDSHLDLPEPGSSENVSQQQRIALALIRMMIFGSAMALTGRQGCLLVDEAWTVLGAGRSEVERLGRLARSQQVLPMLFTQRVTDALNANLAGYISRGLILPIADWDEALAACELFKLEPTPERMARITAKATIGGTSSGEAGAPNWQSMRALRDPITRETLRGAVAIYADLSGRAVPVEVKIPASFLAAASTNPDDIRSRMANKAAAAAAPHNAQNPSDEPAMVEVAPAGPTRQAAPDAWSGWGRE